MRTNICQKAYRKHLTMVRSSKYMLFALPPYSQQPVLLLILPFYKHLLLVVRSMRGIISQEYGQLFLSLCKNINIMSNFCFLNKYKTCGVLGRPYNLIEGTDNFPRTCSYLTVASYVRKCQQKNVWR